MRNALHKTKEPLRVGMGGLGTAVRATGERNSEIKSGRLPIDLAEKPPNRLPRPTYFNGGTFKASKEYIL